MSRLGEVRDGLRTALADIPCQRLQISLLGGKYDEGTEKFGVRFSVGDESPETEEAIDELLAPEGPVLTALARDPSLGGIIGNLAVRSHSGVRAFPQPDGSVLLGTEFLVEVYR